VSFADHEIAFSFVQAGSVAICDNATQARGG
jgi:hypothetical protein